jgi:oxidase EvaA
MMSDHKNEFLISLFADDDQCYGSSEAMLDWLQMRRKAVKVSVQRISFAELKRWHFSKSTGNLLHDSGSFFSIEGITIQSNFGLRNRWDQPIINQPEIGILGFITKKISGVLHFLVQAKIEPGNINFIQLSPTLQATKSNYTRVHGGKKPQYLSYFTGETKATVLMDQLQSEQGARFLRKRNRNMIVEVYEDLEIHDDFTWMSLGQIKKFMKLNNVVNMDTRTVLSAITYPKEASLAPPPNLDLKMYMSATANDDPMYTMEEHIIWITRLKFMYELNITNVGLNKIKGWVQDNDEIRHEQGKYFSVIAVQAKIDSREVTEWTQPIIRSAQEGVIGFLIKMINGVYHFLVQAKVECGNFDILELAPTVQCLTGNYRKGFNEYDVPFIEYFLEKKGKVLHSSYQSEEGGRFFEEQNWNICLIVDDTFQTEGHPMNFRWMTLGQLMEFIKYNNYLNIQARSLISLLDLKEY